MLTALRLSKTLQFIAIIFTILLILRILQSGSTFLCTGDMDTTVKYFRQPVMASSRFIGVYGCSVCRCIYGDPPTHTATPAHTPSLIPPQPRDQSAGLHGQGFLLINGNSPVKRITD